MLELPTKKHKGNDTIFVHLLGGFTVWLGPNQIEEEAFSRKKAKQLLKLLALQSNFRLHREQVIECLWPDLSISSAKAQLYKAVHQVRRALSTANPNSSPEELLSLKEEISLQASGGVTTNFNTFCDLTEKALKTGDVNDLERALAEYSGDLLPADLYEEWTVEPRNHLQTKMVRLLEKLGEVQVNEGNTSAAAVTFQRLLTKDPLHEFAQVALLKIYASEGNKSRFEEHYKGYSTLLVEEMGIEPPSEIKELYEQLHRDIKDLAPQKIVSLPKEPLPSLVVHNLPPISSPLIGREEELKIISEQLSNPTCRLLTLWGAGGIGKTHLSLEAARLQLESFNDGIFFVALAPVSLTSFLIGAVADALSLPITTSNPKGQIIDYLRQRQLLLVIDNFEHLSEGAELLTELIYHAPDVKLLVTSRERLNLKEEWVLPIKGLSYPETTVTGELKGFSAIELFVKSAKRTGCELKLDKENIAAIANITQLVEGMPLALELAASWVTTLSCSEIASELKKSLELLSTKLKNVPERHRSAQAVFDYSWQFLSEEEKQIYARLSIFLGSFTLEAAKQVTGASLILLNALLNKSLLNHNSNLYSIHPLLKQYALEKLSIDRRELEQVSKAHSHYYSSFLQNHEKDLKGGQQKVALKELSAAFEDIRASWRWAIEARDVEVLNNTLEGMWLMYELRAWFNLGVDSFNQVIEALSASKKKSNKGKFVVLKAKTRLGRCLLRLGLNREAYKTLEQSLSELEKSNLDSPSEEAFMLNNIGLTLKALGQQEEAKNNFERALTIYDNLGDNWGIANALYNLGYTNAAQGNLKEAAQYYNDSLDIYSSNNDLRGIGLALGNLGVVSEKQGNYSEAKSLFEKSLETARELEDSYVETQALKRLGYLAIALEDFTEAEVNFSKTLECAKKAGNRLEVANAKRTLGQLAYKLNHYSEAESLYQKSLSIYRQLGNRWGTAYTLGDIGKLHEEQASNTLNKAKRVWLESLNIALELNATSFMLEALMSLAGIFVQQNQTEIAFKLVNLVANHPQAPHTMQEKALGDVDRLAKSFSVDDLEFEKGPFLELEVVVKQLLKH